MFGFLKKYIRIKTKEIEAKLRPTAACTYGGVGEIELSWFADGSVEAELKLKHAGIPDGTTVEFFGDGRRIGTAVIAGGFAKAYEKLSAEGLTLTTGSSAELRVNGEKLYEGQFRPD